MKRSLTKRPAEKNSNYGRRYTPEQHQHALLLVASGMSNVEASHVIGATDKSIGNWVTKAKAEGTMPEVPVVTSTTTQASTLSAEESTRQNASKAELQTAVVPSVKDAGKSKSKETQKSTAKSSPYAPKDPGQGLSEPEVAAILELKRRHPSYGPAQIRAQLKRFKGWRMSIKAIARVLRRHGYELVHRGSRPQGPEPIRFEAPRRNALWQMDFAEMRISQEKFHLLVVIDDFSRYIVAHQLCSSQSSESAIETLLHAIARHGKPEAVRTDRGGAFVSKEFNEFLENELIDHIVGRPYHPEGGGKVESLIGTVRRELWDVEHFADRVVAERRLGEFVVDYNEHRAHMGIDGLTPADKYFGRADQVLAKIDAISRQRNGVLAQLTSGNSIEETIAARCNAPMEVMRLAIVDGQMELRFCGARIRLGSIAE